MKIKQLADLSGVSVRTLHHYDDIGLLRPKKSDANGYRDYCDADVDRLQQILLLRACGFPLKAIEELLNNPYLSKEQIFFLQKQTLLHEKQRIEAMLATLEKTEQAELGGIKMSNEEKFTGFDFSKNPYEAEARQRWGDKTVDESNAKWAAKSPEEQQAVGEEFNALFAGFAQMRNIDPKSEQAQAQTDKLYHFLGTFGDFYTKEVFAGMGQMYVDDKRFTKNIDQFGEGTAQFISDAIAYYVQQ